ncbi:phosphoribosyltransferase family protein [Patescibacteria group bacterium]
MINDILCLSPKEMPDLVLQKISRFDEKTELPVRKLSAKEILYIFKCMNGFWTYAYQLAKNGKVGKHAELKSKRHSDGFLNSKMVLNYHNLRWIIAWQLFLLYKRLNLTMPNYVVGVPTGASELGKDVAQLMHAKNVTMEKQNGKIKLISSLEKGKTVLLVEDFCTKGTGFKEAVHILKQSDPEVNIIPYELVVINRGGLKKIEANATDKFKITALSDHRINDWHPSECPLCKMGSIPIKPKVSKESWIELTTSQL